jgi:hypothetical protein
MEYLQVGCLPAKICGEERNKRLIDEYALRSWATGLKGMPLFSSKAESARWKGGEDSGSGMLTLTMFSA